MAAKASDLAQAPGGPANFIADLDKIMLLPQGVHERTLVFLHGYGMEDKDHLELFTQVSKSFPTWRFVLPQAPIMKVTATYCDCPSWFDYLSDHGGAREDTVDVFSLRVTREALRRVLHAEVTLLGGDSQRVFLGGLSQGGIMALDLATHVKIGGVATMLAPRCSLSLPRPLAAPWLALMTTEDEVFPLSWARSLLAGVTELKLVPGNHWLDEQQELQFVAWALEKFQTMVNESG